TPGERRIFHLSFEICHLSLGFIWYRSMKNPFRRCVTIFAVFLALLLGLSISRKLSKASAENSPQPLASYKIDVQLKLDDKQHPKHLEGQERLSWLNDSPDTINDLQFHLYLNAFKNEKSSFFKESGGELRGDKFQSGQWGWIDVK